MNAITPIPSIIPESAPFSTEQRAWLNGFFAAYLGVNGATAAGDDAQPADPDEDFPGTMRRCRWLSAWNSRRSASPSVS